MNMKKSQTRTAGSDNFFKDRGVWKSLKYYHFLYTPALKKIITSGGTRLRFLHIHNVSGLKTSEIAKRKNSVGIPKRKIQIYFFFIFGGFDPPPS